MLRHEKDAASGQTAQSVQRRRDRSRKERHGKPRFTDSPVLPKVCDLRLALSEDHSRCTLVLITDGECTSELEEAAREALVPWLPAAPIVERIQLEFGNKPAAKEEPQADEPELPFDEQPIRELIASVVQVFHYERLKACGRKCLRFQTRETMLQPEDLVQNAQILLIVGGLEWRGVLELLLRSMSTTIFNFSRDHEDFERKMRALEGDNYTRPQDWTDADWKGILTLLNGDIDKALEVLSEAERQVFVMRFVEEMTPAEIAEALGKRPQTVQNQLASAKKKVIESGRLDAYRPPRSAAA